MAVLARNVQNEHKHQIRRVLENGLVLVFPDAPRELRNESLERDGVLAPAESLQELFTKILDSEPAERVEVLVHNLCNFPMRLDSNRLAVVLGDCRRKPLSSVLSTVNVSLELFTPWLAHR